MMESSSSLSPPSTYPWGVRHDGDGTFGESLMPRDDSLADIAPWTSPEPAEPERHQSPVQSRRQFGLGSLSASTSRLRHTSSNVTGPSSSGTGQHLSSSQRTRHRGDSDASGDYPPHSSTDAFDATPQKAGKNSFLNFIRKKASRPALHRDLNEGYGGSMAAPNFDLNELSTNGFAPSASTSNFFPSDAHSGSLSIPGNNVNKRSRKASQKNKLALLTPSSASVPPMPDSYVPLDVNALDMSGIIDPRVNLNGGDVGMDPTDSPVDISRQPWDLPEHQHQMTSSPGAGPSGSGSGSYDLTSGHPNGTPFSNLNPFGASTSSRNGGRGRLNASNDAGPFDSIPEHSSSSYNNIHRHFPYSHTNDTQSYSPTGAQHPHSQYHSSTSHSRPSNGQQGFPAYPQQAYPTTTTAPPNWEAPDSWQTVPRPGELQDEPGGDDSSDEEPGSGVGLGSSVSGGATGNMYVSSGDTNGLKFGYTMAALPKNGRQAMPPTAPEGISPFDVLPSTSTSTSASSASVIRPMTSNAASGPSSSSKSLGVRNPSRRPSTADGSVGMNGESYAHLQSAYTHPSHPSTSSSSSLNLNRSREKSLPQTPLSDSQSPFPFPSHSLAPSQPSRSASVTTQRPLPSTSLASLGSYPLTQSQSRTSSNTTPTPSKPPTVQASVRIYRTDGKYHVVNCPPNTTVAVMRSALGKKLGIKGETHRLYMREKGRQTPLGNQQSPAKLLHRRLEQAGYTSYDDLEVLGGEDLGFLVRFIFRNASLGVGDNQVDEDTFHSGYDHVELPERTLETVPIVLHRHAAQIITLNLSKNPLVDLPQDFVTDCTSLRELRLTNVAMKRLPRSVRLIKSLQWLDISSNRIPDLEQAGLEQIGGLRQIFVQNNRLTNLPSSFSHMLSLKFLNISNNKFEEIPPVICEMPNLVDLDVSFNSISVLPPGLGKLIALERLIIVGNQIATFPAEVQLMISLKELDCRRNLITDLAPLSNLPRLESLLAEHNLVSMLDFVVGPRLVTLNTSHNRTARSTLRPLLPNSRFSLTTLDLSHLKLSSFDEDGKAFDAFTSLITLKLDYNQFRSIPDAMCNLKELEHFSCTNNDLHSLPDNIGNWKKLKTLAVHNNNIKVVPEGIWECESLVELNMSSNSLEGWMDPGTVFSSLSSMGLTEDDDDPLAVERKGSAAGISFTNRTVPPLANSLQKLLLADNYLGVTNRTAQFDVFRTLSYMQELRVLNLSFNQLNELPPLHLQGFAHLHELYLSGNNLTSLPGETMQKLLKLKVLHLNGNKLQTLPAELGKVAGLETLDVGNNQLKYNVLNWQYDWNWNFNSQLKYLNLSGNKRLEIKNMAHSMTMTGSASIFHPPAPNANARLFDFGDLRKLCVLGLMDVTLRGGSLPDDCVERRVRTSETEINGMAYGIADTLGSVDGPMTFDLAHQKFRGKDNEALFGMFGRTQPNLSANRAAKYLQEQFPRAFQDALHKSLDKTSKGMEDVGEALRSAFLGLNRSLYEHLVMRGFKDGLGRKLSTISMSGPVGSDLKAGASAIVIYIVDRPSNKTMYVANVGDMLAVVSQSNGNFITVSSKHDPFERSEIERIRAAEGWVSPKGMVNEEEDLSRNFGLYHLLPAVNARPDIVAYDLTELDEFVIIGNRGLWDHISYRTAVDIGRHNRDDPMKAAQMLRDYAMAYGADGNTVIMVIAVADLFPGSARYRNLQEDGYVSRRNGPRPERDRLLRMLDESVTPPTGHLSLVFTDIRNSTSLWEKNVGMPIAMKAHNEMLRRQARWIGGYEVKTEGDSFMMAFQTLPAAVLWCVKVQTDLLALDWPMEILESEEGREIYDDDDNLIARGLSVRMGIHWGKPVCAEDPTTHRMDYFGPMVNRSARIMGQALGGQIMISSDVAREIKLWLEDETPPANQHIDMLKKMGVEIKDEGSRMLKGLEAPEELAALVPTSLLGRAKGPSAAPVPAPDASRVQFNLEHIAQLNMLTLRLEALATSRVFRSAVATDPSPPPNTTPTSEPETPTSPGPSIILKADPQLLMPTLKPDASDQDIMTLLDYVSGRIENALSTLQLRAMMQSIAGNDRLTPLEDVNFEELSEALRLVRQSRKS